MTRWWHCHIHKMRHTGIICSSRGRAALPSGMSFWMETFSSLNSLPHQRHPQAAGRDSLELGGAALPAQLPLQGTPCLSFPWG